MTLDKRHRTIFLTAEWKYLAMVNCIIDPAVLKPYVPKGTELDEHNGNCYVSLVAFRFLNTKIKGVAIPFHADFEEINLRFYVRRKSQDYWRRGVVFIKEIVPRTMIAFVANNLYNENYIALDTGSDIDFVENMPTTAKYSWKSNNVQNYISISVRNDKKELLDGSEEDFIAEHYWSYSIGRNYKTTKYRVEHPNWYYWDADITDVCVDIENLYGRQFTEALYSEPHSAFLAEGSNVTVSHGVNI